jgi:hypothetical protein
MAKRKRNTAIRYSDKQKSVAVETVRAAGGFVSDRVLADVRLVLDSANLSLSTLHAWVKNAERQPKIDHSTSDTRITDDFDPNAEAIAMWKRTKINYLRRANAPSALIVTDGKDAVAAAERAQKMEQLLAGLPTAIVDALPTLTALVQLFDKFNIRASDVFEDLVQQYATALTNIERHAESDNV